MERDAKIDGTRQRQCEIHPVWRIQNAAYAQPRNGCPQNTYGFHKGHDLGRVLCGEGASNYRCWLYRSLRSKYNGVGRKQYIAKHAEVKSSKAAPRSEVDRAA